MLSVTGVWGTLLTVTGEWRTVLTITSEWGTVLTQYVPGGLDSWVVSNYLIILDDSTNVLGCIRCTVLPTVEHWWPVQEHNSLGRLCGDILFLVQPLEEPLPVKYIY